MLILLDTSILIEIDAGNQKVISKLSELANGYPASDCAISWVNFFEFYYGSMGDQKMAENCLQFLNKFSFLEMTKEATKIFTRFRKEKTNVKDFDLLIGSIAIANNALLVTMDGDFKRIKGLNYRLIE